MKAWRADHSLIIAIAASAAFCAAIWLANDNLAHWTLAQRAPGGPRIYPWQLAEPGFWTRVTAWSGYTLHQLCIWGLIWKAQRARPAYTVELKPINLQIFAATAGFITLHFLQTHLFYDGLAQDVPEWSAQWSVILLLLMVILIENQRRGIAFGLPWGGFVREASDFCRKYHGYYFAWATIYTFWYHPLVFTSGHALGFFYMFLLFTQSALVFTRAHRNRYWTIVLELLVIVHGVMVALMNTDGNADMFGFGLAGIFVVTQAFGLGLPRPASWALCALYALGVSLYYADLGWERFPAVLRIFGGYYLALPLLALLIVLLARIGGIRPRGGLHSSLPVDPTERTR
jgi:uncharacterized protein YhhL (DUF1145 family)